MNIDFIVDLQKRPRLRLKTKKLFYSCDLLVSAEMGESQLKLVTSGEGRFGPKKSTIEVQSLYTKKDNFFIFTSTNFNFPGLKREESYKVGGSVIESIVNGNSVKIKKSPLAVFDFSLLMHLLVRDHKLEETVHLPIGHKLREVNLQSQNGKTLLSLGSKVDLEHKAGKISVPKFKVSLDCTFE